MSILKQYHLETGDIDEPLISTDAQDQPIATTYGEGWYAIKDQALLDQLYETLSGNGEIWVEEGELKVSGGAPTPYHIFDRSTKSWRLLNEEDNARDRQAYLDLIRNAKQEEINRKAQAFVSAVAELDKTPQFEQATWQEQANEALAWYKDRNAPTPTLDEIAQNRNVPVELLRQKAYEKTMQYRRLTNTIAGQRQHFEDKLNQAQTAQEIDAINVVYHFSNSEESEEKGNE